MRFLDDNWQAVAESIIILPQNLFSNLIFLDVSIIGNISEESYRTLVEVSLFVKELYLSACWPDNCGFATEVCGYSLPVYDDMDGFKIETLPEGLLCTIVLDGAMIYERMPAGQWVMTLDPLQTTDQKELEVKYGAKEVAREANRLCVGVIFQSYQ
ncbi:hypothetical protein M422DRAFT_264082 [Sphaerobolus stellatus SS14]|uniref:Uncharacterized protein n=1 Tax=Sphaerobolus stellatus (strain SS14) TaxID=990650 RepID=A0A0C9TUC7_SPHS4|nr:hypothetical protein M422DRAFT_264082 [Sphaerobolus stellatus SS14]